MKYVRGSIVVDGECGTLTMTAAITGPPETIGRQETRPVGDFVTGFADVCEMAGASDMPGTVVHLAASSSAGLTATTDYPLPDNSALFVMDLESIPPAGSRVAPGQPIDLLGVAILAPFAQGVKELKLTSGGVLIKQGGNYSSTQEPVKCDMGRYGGELRARDDYKVPARPPAVIEICAEGLTFDGKKAMPDCAKFYTGEVWTGTVTGTTTQPGCSPASSPVTGSITLAVEDDGTVTGSSTERRAGYSCGGTAIPHYDNTFPITGKKTPTGFDLTVQQKSLTLPISGKKATKTFTSGSGGYGATVTYTAMCQNCE